MIWLMQLAKLRQNLAMNLRLLVNMLRENYDVRQKTKQISQDTNAMLFYITA